MSEKPILLWLRLDLRLADHPALDAAAKSGRPVIPIFIWSPEEEHPWEPGAASRWWLHHSLVAHDKSLQGIGSRLILRAGDSLTTLRELIRSTQADSLYYSHRYEPALVARDRQIESTLRAEGIDVRTFNSALLIDPHDLATQTGTPFKVFTPFWRRLSSVMPPPPPLPSPKVLKAPSAWPKSLTIDDLKLQASTHGDDDLLKTWQPGEKGAMARLKAFEKPVLLYDTQRDHLAADQTSRLSPHLHFGEISPRTIWHRLANRANTGAQAASIESFLRQIAWREFAHSLLVHFPHTTDRPLRPEFANFAWNQDPDALHSWQEGRTGYPAVDAGMRQLRATGWMHNRARLIVGSFLVKDLRINWLEGARWFWDTLVDADLANNTLGWQWVAGTGADAAPYFRIFNPTAQGQRFDPDGAYVRQWLPELSRLDTRWIHQPSVAPPEILQAAKIILGKTYPRPLVDHAIARMRALAAYESIRK